MRVLVANCSVEYQGRLGARLPAAPRLIILKADGSIAVHADAKAYKPLNWMSPPCTVREEDGRLVATNPSGETLTIELHEVLHDYVVELGDDPGLAKDGVEAELQELLEAREDAEAEGAPPDELAAIDERVKQYALAHVRKVDSTAVALRACRGFQEECEKEASRLWAQAKRHMARHERIKSAVMWAMAQLGVTKLSTPQNTLRVQGNGGLEPLEVYDSEQLPTDKQIAIVTMRRDAFEAWQKREIEHGGTMIDAPYRVQYQPNNEAIRAELKKRVPCPSCTGVPDVDCICARCNDTGTVPARVPGARLLPRGTQLRVE